MPEDVITCDINFWLFQGLILGLVLGCFVEPTGALRQPRLSFDRRSTVVRLSFQSLKTVQKYNKFLRYAREKEKMYFLFVQNGQKWDKKTIRGANVSDS